MEIAARSFELIENTNGHASDRTVMTFGPESRPFRATYSGPNVRFGQAIVEDFDGKMQMLYHALTDDGQLIVGKALVSFVELDDGLIEMHLNWKWLTGDESEGVSKWRELNKHS